MIDEDHRQGSRFPVESLLRFLAARDTPGLDALVGARIEEPLVGADDAGLRRPGDRPLAAHVLRPEAVVVEKEQGREHRGSTRALPDHVGILRRQDVEAPAERDQGLILLFPSRPAGAVRPELVVSRDPDCAGESRRRGFERHLEVLERLTDVPPEDEPVLGMRSQALQGFAVLAMTEVQIADGVKPHLSRLPYNVGASRALKTRPAPCASGASPAGRSRAAPAARAQGERSESRSEKRWGWGPSALD